MLDSLAQTSNGLLPLQISLDLSGETLVHKALLEVGKTLDDANVTPGCVAAAAIELGGPDEWVTLGSPNLDRESGDPKPLVEGAISFG